jgi:hypothetical protein
MTLAKEISKRVSKRQKTEETIKKAVMYSIEFCADVAGYPNRAYFGGGAQLQRLLIDSGWSKAASINDLNFDEVMGAVDFIINFLEKEGFQVETTCNAYGINFIITWEKN